jgi:hypothetical protein
MGGRQKGRARREFRFERISSAAGGPTGGGRAGGSLQPWAASPGELCEAADRGRCVAAQKNTPRFTANWPSDTSRSTFPISLSPKYTVTLCPIVR